jgi:hypothetical protein
LKIQTEKTDGGIKSRKSRERKPMGESRVENPDRENRWGNQKSKIQTEKTDGGIKSRKSRERKPMGESRIENPDRENRWRKQE